LAEGSIKEFDSPDEVRNIPKGRIEVVSLGNFTVARGTFEPGWRWSNDVKPIVGTESCQVRHLGCVLSGRIHVRMDDGTEFEAGPGTAFEIPPGHDGWVVGDEPYVGVEFDAQSATTFAKGTGSTA
jgi:hypothetical protein